MRASPPSVYLHFLNREMARAVGAPFDGTINETRLLLAAVLTRKPLASSLAFAWESGLLIRPNSPLTLLLSGGQLELLSEHQTREAFLASVQDMYRHDRPRYSMYFEPLPEGVEGPEPTATKTGSTTAALGQELEVIADDPVSSDSLTRLPAHDREAIAAARADVSRALHQREGRAFTISLFADVLGGERPLLPTGRLLSMLHLRHYLELTSGDIVTGLWGLTYFDQAASGFPRFHAPLASPILSRVGLGPHQLRSHGTALTALRGSDEHRIFLSQLLPLMGGAYEIAPQGRSGFEPRRQGPTLHHALEELIGSAGFAEPLTSLNVYSEAADRLARLNIIAENRARWYRDRKNMFMADQEGTTRVLILVANDTEREAVREAAREAGGGVSLERSYVGQNTVFHLGIIGGSELLLVQSEQGTESPSAMTLTAFASVSALRPSAVIMVGIAYGFRENEQTLGDVMVSTQVRLGDHIKVTTERGRAVELRRGDHASASGLLLDRFRSSVVDWNGPQVHFGPIVSRNVLVNHRKLREKFRRKDRDAIGGEMEGAGLYSAAVREKVDWIIVKGISDWGFGKTDREQVLAARNAARLTLHVARTGALRSQRTV